MNRYKIRIKNVNGINIITVIANNETDAKNKIKLPPQSEITGIREVKTI